MPFELPDNLHPNCGPVACDDLEARDLLTHPTIRELAAFAAAREGDGAASSRPSLKSLRHGARREGAFAS